MEVRALLEMAIPLANYSSVDQYLRALDCVDAKLRSGEGDALKRAAVRALYLCRRIGAGKRESGDLAECKNVAAKLREAGDRRLLGDVQHSLGFALFHSSEYREAYRSAEESFAILLEGYEENLYLSGYFHSHAHLVGSCLHFLGEWGEVLRKIEQRVGIVEKNGDRLGSTIALLERPWLQICAMDFAGAQQILESALPVVASFQFIRRYCLVLTGLAEAGLGNHQRALEQLLTCRDSMDQVPMLTDWYWRMPIHQALTEVWLSTGELDKARLEAEECVKIALPTQERTFGALAFEVSARVAMAEGDLPKAQDRISKAVQAMEGFEVPLAHWRVHATAYELFQRMKQRDAAKKHRELSRDTIMKLANSLPAEEPLRQIFLSAPMVRKVLGDE